MGTKYVFDYLYKVRDRISPVTYGSLYMRKVTHVSNFLPSYSTIKLDSFFLPSFALLIRFHSN